MWWLIFIDGTLPIGDSIYVLGVVIFVVIPILTLRADSSSSLPNQGDVIGNPEAPPVDAGAQGKHVIGHNNYIPGSKSAWPEGSDGVEETQEAWLNGKPVKPDGSVRVGTAKGQKVKVHINKRGRIHGYPVGEVKRMTK